MAELKYYFGIDFGTTSCATVGYTVIKDEVNKIYYGDLEDRPIPSNVAIDRSTGEVFTGRKAWEKRTELSETCEYITSIKSILDSDWKKEIGGRIWTPVDVAAEIFKELKNTVAERTGAVLNFATVATPIGFSADKRRKLREAAYRADIKILSYVSEPTAAFFANRKHLQGSSNVVIFDWGGGTLDVTVIKKSNDRIFELATVGLQVAGDDIDRKLAERIHSRVARKKKAEISFDDMSALHRDMLLVRAERAKRALSISDTATVSINNYGMLGAFRETLEYEWFAEVIEPEVDQAVACLKKAIDQSGVGKANIDCIVMVGGSSNLRPLMDRLDREYDGIIFFPDETMWNVGEGAAELSLSPGEYLSNQTIGIKLSDGKLFKLLEPNILLDSWKTEHSFGIVDTSQEARFVFSGSADLDDSSDTFRAFTVPSYRFLQEKINLEASVDENLIFSIKAGSNMRSEEFSRIWEYTQLKCCYLLPESAEKNER